MQDSQFSPAKNLKSNKNNELTNQNSEIENNSIGMDIKEINIPNKSL
jgi:hypothetical protein